MTYDVVVVGGRCAGASLARLLARAGKRVVIVDASELPSDQPMSTHFISVYGMRIVDELGLGDKVREIAPTVHTFINGCEQNIARMKGDWGSCPRRDVLDALLLDGAREAGAEVRTRTKLVDLMREGDRVVGAVVEDAQGKHELRAQIVVGADGRNSTVAELAGAEEYFGYDGPRAAYWSYWRRPSWYDTDPRYEGAAMIVYEQQYARVVFPTNRDQLCIGATFPNAQIPDWKADPRAKLEAVLRASTYTAPLLEGEQIEKVRGLVKIRFFFKRAAGKGWALAGDAGVHKDPHGGLGISDALADAKELSQAILAGGDQALERFWRERDVRAWELYSFTRDLGEVDYNNALNQTLFRHVAASPVLQERIHQVATRELSPYLAFKPAEIIKMTLGALVRGRFGVLPAFFRAAKRGGAVAKELERRKQLLAPALAPAPARPPDTIAA
ncbi:MAG TPA: NAD(P)/FAD-dependent oxidoreductase [Kofleriaceae bacterium]|nr:NAD(P)/FAD-dependent oxidoreductase [Kofleriaceae bacterium]